MEFMGSGINWIFLGVILGALAYLVQIILSFIEKYKEGKANNEQGLIDLQRLDNQLKESEHSRMETEDRAAKLEEEVLLYEQQASELNQKIRNAMPSSRESSGESSSGG